MHFVKFFGSVIGTASLATFVLTGLVKALHAVQAKATAGAAVKAMFR